MFYTSTKPYPYLPEGKNIEYVPASNEFMVEAERECKTQSTDTAHSTGAVIVKDGKIIGRGANQSALKSETLRQWHKKYFCVRRLLNIPSGQKYWLCPGCSKYKHHAEAVAIKNAKSKNMLIQGADLYLYGHWWCCQPCWDKMQAAGISNVYLVEGATELFSR
jgi:deoxycytidylate deaminase